MAEITTEQLIDHLSQMSVMDMASLVKTLEEKWGVSAAPVAVAGAAGPAPSEEPKEEQTEFDVELKEIGPNRINVIKAVREITGLGLKEAKEMVESAPKVVKEAMPKAEAEEIQKKLQEAGAKVDLK